MTSREVYKEKSGGGTEKREGGGSGIQRLKITLKDNRLKNNVARCFLLNINLRDRDREGEEERKRGRRERERERGGEG